MQKTIGGDRLGSGKKMKVDLHGYERSTHDMGYLWRSTMSAGTLVPFLVEVALPGDTFDINLHCDIKTHPTVGPLFGSYKVQLDVFQCPIRLYQGQLHNNKLGIGMNMANVKLPLITLFADPDVTITGETDLDNLQINPSCILSYLGIRGVGMVDPDEPTLVPREFNAIPLLAYWDIYKNYYANKQETNGWVIHQELQALITTVTAVLCDGGTVPQWNNTQNNFINGSTEIAITYTGTQPLLSQIIFYTSAGQLLADSVAKVVTTVGSAIHFLWDYDKTGNVNFYAWDYISNNSLPITTPTPTAFTLDAIDDMREQILAAATSSVAFDVNGTNIQPYSSLLTWVSNLSPYKNTQEGLALKTYQSDLFNNWLSTEWIDGSGGINDITAIDTSGGSFNIDTLQLSKKVYDMLNRIAISGGSYDDWLDAVYTHDRYTKAESPIYHGGLIKELIFQEVVSNSMSDNVTNTQPLGTLAGKGTMSSKHKGGDITIKVDEPSYIIGIVSLTPRIDYSQGNKWDTGLVTMDDLHKPALDEIGFQELITEQMAWWSTYKLEATPGWIQQSAGKQPAWLNYMTNVNQVRGNFAIADNEMFMTLNRRYEWNESLGTPGIQDLTTYIDPSKYNNIFAYTALDSQNFWTQIAVDMTARRKMSAKIMPNL